MMPKEKVTRFDLELKIFEREDLELIVKNLLSEDEEIHTYLLGMLKSKRYKEIVKEIENEFELNKKNLPARKEFPFQVAPSYGYENYTKLRTIFLPYIKKFKTEKEIANFPKFNNTKT